MPYYFNLPLITDLTIDQQLAVDEMDEGIILTFRLTK